MREQILVPLRKRDGVKEIIPYIEKITKPGRRVIFLVHHPVDGFKWLQAYCAIMASGIAIAPAVRKMVESHSIEERRRLAGQKVFLTCEALHKTGVEMAVDVYGGSLKKVIKRYARNGDGHLIMMPASGARRITNFLQGKLPLFSLFRRPSFSSVLLFHPSALL